MSGTEGKRSTCRSLTYTCSCYKLKPTVDLRHMASTLDAQPDVQVLEAVAPEQQNGLEGLEPQDIGLDELERSACGAEALSSQFRPRGLQVHPKCHCRAAPLHRLTIQLDAAISGLAMRDGDCRLLQCRRNPKRIISVNPAETTPCKYPQA